MDRTLFICFRTRNKNDLSRRRNPNHLYRRRDTFSFKRKKFKKKEKIEFTLEANAEDLSKEKVEILSTYGVNRVSLGVQTFHKKLGDVLERHTAYETVKRGISLLHQVGISNINLDLMYAIPSEEIKDVKEDLSKILKLPITHISTYSLILEEHTKLYLKNLESVEEDLDYEMYHLIQNTLEEKGFMQYEISNFAKEGYESKHNIVYWNNEMYYGFGLGASSYIGNIRKTNTRSLTSYFEGKGKSEIETIDERRNMEYEMILGLRKRKGVSLQKFEEKFHRSLLDVFFIEKLINQGFLEKQGDFIRIPQDKMYLSNEILLAFLLDE